MCTILPFFCPLFSGCVTAKLIESRRIILRNSAPGPDAVAQSLTLGLSAFAHHNFLPEAGGNSASQISRSQAIEQEHVSLPAAGRKTLCSSCFLVQCSGLSHQIRSPVHIAIRCSKSCNSFLLWAYHQLAFCSQARSCRQDLGALTW